MFLFFYAANLEPIRVIMERALKVAREMLADGMPVDKITRYTELSIAEIEHLV